MTNASEDQHLLSRTEVCHLFILKDEQMAPGEYGVCFQWGGHMIPAEVEDWERPTRANLLRAARSAIDLIKAVESEGFLGPDGLLKAEG